jgi:nicotinamidase-related amidase
MVESARTGSFVPAFIAEWFDRLESRPLAEIVADPAATAVFSSDMIVGFCDHGNLASPRVDALSRPIAGLFERAHALGVRQFILLQDTHDPDAVEFAAWPVHCVRGSEEAETIPELRALPFAGDLVRIEKNTLNPALGTRFDAWLDAHPELRTAIVVGNCTDLCVYQLAMHLRLRANARGTRDFAVIVPADAVDTYDLPAEAVSAPVFAHPGDFFHRVFLYHLALNGVRVVRSLTA